jgi:hypothetical protein
LWCFLAASCFAFPSLPVLPVRKQLLGTMTLPELKCTTVPSICCPLQPVQNIEEEEEEEKCESDPCTKDKTLIALCEKGKLTSQ